MISGGRPGYSGGQGAAVLFPGGRDELTALEGSGSLAGCVAEGCVRAADVGRGRRARSGLDEVA